MAIEHDFWTNSFNEASFPPWPCPSCGRHSLSITPNSLSLAETRDSREAHSNPDWDYDWREDRFVCLLTCQRCNQVCSVAGTTRYEYGGESITRELEPRFVDPAPDIFRISNTCPSRAAQELRAAFALFWNDPNAALNRVRASLEALLDSEKVQRKAKTKKGDFRPLSLHQRIEKFLPKDVSTQKKMLAVKWLGNVGSHEGATRIQLLEAFELVENLLEILVDKRPQRLDRKAREITRRKGKPKPFLLLGTAVPLKRR